MNIPVIAIHTCTWVLDGENFYCTHDERIVEQFTQDHMGLNGHYQTESLGYVCADPDCREVLDGSPEEDAIDEDAEYERSRDD